MVLIKVLRKMGHLMEEELSAFSSMINLVKEVATALRRASRSMSMLSCTPPAWIKVASVRSL